MTQLALSDDLEPAPKRRDATAQLAKCNAILASRPAVAIDRPTCFVCGSPCGSGEIGHARCTGRRAA